MHRVRRAAKREAWSDPNNPFSKVQSREKKQIDDEETGRRPRVTTYQSDNVAFNNSKHKANPDALPPKANTLPVSPKATSGPSNLGQFTDRADFGEKGRGSGEDTSDTFSHDVYEEPEKEEEEADPEPEAPTQHHMNGILGNPNGGEKRTLRQRLPIFGRKKDKSQEKEPSKKKSGFLNLRKDHKWGAYPFTPWGQFKNTICNSYINLLLIAVPVGIAVNYVKIDPVGIFVVNFIAIIPLAAMLSYATEEIAMHTGETIGGLLNASFGNAVELIVSIIALTHKPEPEIVIVQTSLIGSILSNLLLVLGMCFFFGGINRPEQHFNVVVAQTAASLLALAVGSIIIPAAFNAWSSGSEAVQQTHIAQLSRGTSVLLLLVYACYLIFQLKTHVAMYNEPSKKVQKRKKKVPATAAQKGIAHVGATSNARAAAFVPKEDVSYDGTNSEGRPTSSEAPSEDDEEKEKPQLFIWVAVLTLCVSTAFVGLCAEFMVDSINALTERAHLSKTFVGLILLPIVGNAAEHATAVTVACKDKMDLAIGVAVGSSMQIALLVIPFVVVLGWILGFEQMSLDFDGYQVAVLFVAVLLVNYLIQDGKSHWLEGVLLMTLYLIIAVSAWFYPADENPAAAANPGKLRF